MKDPRKSDVDAKTAYVKELELKGYKNIKIIAKPADIYAEKNNKKYFFEIKKTTQKDKYFGASTITEWEGALDKNNNYLFIVAKSLDNNMWEFIEYKPEELMKYSTIPPFHIYFNLPLSEKEKNKQRTNKTAVIANNKNINLLIKFFKKLKKNV
tara:strand:+ start:58 stop:519 length:462 start_codon:yes stop_codon:yes gene_type:complete